MFFSCTLFKKNTTVLPLGCKQYNTIGCIHTTMLECKELTDKIVNYNYYFISMNIIFSVRIIWILSVRIIWILIKNDIQYF